jgi:hypothetical protein
MLLSVSTSFISQADLNVGDLHSYGVEVAIQRGNPNENGLSGMLSYTYTGDKIHYAPYANGRSAMDPINESIAAYNALTKAGGGAPCYDPNLRDPSNGAQNAPELICGSTSIRNPYYDNSPQPLLNRNGWYNVYTEGTPAYPPDGSASFLAPNMFNGYVNYRHGRFAITPNFVVQSGGGYGSPTSIIGYDPRTCTANQRSDGITTGDPLKADFSTCGASAQLAGYLAVPDPFTGHFDGMAAYREPWHVNLGLQTEYAFSPRVTGTLILTNLFQRCFGGERTPWWRAFPPGEYVCGYLANGSGFVSNFWNGAGPNDVSANGMGPLKVNTFPYSPFLSQAFALPPFNAYFSLQIKLR